MSRSFNGRVLIGVVLAIVFYALLAFVSDLEELISVGGRFPWLLLPLVMLLATGNYIMRMFRWHLYLRTVRVGLNFKQSAAVFFAGLGMSVSPGKLGELLKAQYIKNINGTNIRVTAPVVIAERLTDLVGVILIASFGVFAFNYGFIFFVFIVLAVGGLLLILSSRRISKWFLRKLSVIPFIEKRTEKLESSIDSMATLNKLPRLLPATLLSILAWGFEGFGFYIVINAFPRVEVSLYSAMFIYAFSILVGAVSMLPGGLGVTEGAMTGLLVLLDVPKATAFAATLITRFATLWFAVVLGLLTTVLFRDLFGTRQLATEMLETEIEDGGLER